MVCCAVSTAVFLAVGWGVWWERGRRVVGVVVKASCWVLKEQPARVWGLLFRLPGAALSPNCIRVVGCLCARFFRVCVVGVGGGLVVV